MPRPTASNSPTAARGIRYIIIAISLTALTVILWRISDLVAVMFGGILGAAAIRGLALPLASRAGLSDRWGITLTLLGLLATACVLFWLFGQQVAVEVTQMQRLLPEAVNELSDALKSSGSGRVVVNAAKTILNDMDGAKMVSGVGFAAGALLTSIVNAVLIFFLSIYLAFDPHVYLEGFLHLIPPPHRRRVRIALVDAGEALRKWLLAQFVAMIVIGIIVSTTLGLLHVPLALLLGTVAGILEFIPVIGPVLFAIPGLLVAFTQGPKHAMYVFFVYLLVQQLESNVMIPMLQRWALRLPPAITLLSVVGGGLLLGTGGVILATPLTVVTIALINRLYVEGILEGRHTPPSSNQPQAVSAKPTETRSFQAARQR